MPTDIVPEPDPARDERERLVAREQLARQYCVDHNLPHDYDSASRAEKTAILDAAQAATGYHRKSLVRLFRRLRDLAREAILGIVREAKKRGRPAQYLPESATVARELAEKMGMSERKMVGAMPRWVPVVEKLARKVTERLRKPHLSDQVVQDLQSVSSATLGRFIRKDQPRRSRSPRKQRARSRHQRATPLRTWDDWKDLHPGEMQVDSVAHAGGRGGGGHLWTVTVIDVYSEWVDAEAIDGLTQEHVAEALDRMMARTPFAWRSVHTDNGGEFLNDVVIAWCDRNGIARTRGAPASRTIRPTSRTPTRSSSVRSSATSATQVKRHATR